MIKDVIINIKGTQGLDGNFDTIELTTEGKFGIRNDSYMISYVDGTILGNVDVKTRMYIKSDNSVIIQREGPLKSRLIIEQGVRNTCFYRTEQGDISLGIFGENIEHNLSSAGGKILINYSIDNNLILISRNTVNISIKEVSANVNTSSKN